MSPKRDGVPTIPLVIGNSLLLRLFCFFFVTVSSGSFASTLPLLAHILILDLRLSQPGRMNPIIGTRSLKTSSEIKRMFLDVIQEFADQDATRSVDTPISTDQKCLNDFKLRTLWLQNLSVNFALVSSLSNYLSS